MTRTLEEIDNELARVAVQSQHALQIFTVHGIEHTQDVVRIVPDLGEIRRVQNEHTKTLADHTARLTRIETTLSEHSATLADHGATLAEVRTVQEAQSATLERIEELLATLAVPPTEGPD